jgi:hypothetical protein
MDYKEVDLLAICECIKTFLIINPKNWALARPSSLAADTTRICTPRPPSFYFNDLNRMSDRAQANERNILLHADAAARREALKEDPAALETALACLGDAESTEDLSNEPNWKKPEHSGPVDSAAAAAAAAAEAAAAARQVARGRNQAKRRRRLNG